MSVTIVVGGGGAGVRVGELYSGGGGKCPNTGCVATIQNPRDATSRQYVTYEFRRLITVKKLRPRQSRHVGIRLRRYTAVRRLNVIRGGRRKGRGRRTRRRVPTFPTWLTVTKCIYMA